MSFPSLSIHRSTATPTRLIGRLAAEMVFHVFITTQRTFPAAFGSAAAFDRIALFLTVLRHADLPLAPAEARPLGVAAMAASMGMPFETARRHVLTLIHHGLCNRVKGGITLAPTLFDRRGSVALIRELHDVMVAQIDDLRGFDVPMPAPRREAGYRPGDTLTGLLDTSLALLDRNREVYGSALSAIVANAIIIANVRSITYDPMLARQYGRMDTIPPDHLREPIRSASLARTLGMSYSTVAREIGRLAKCGLVTATRHGLVIRQAQLAHTMLSDNNRAALVRAVQLVRRLKMGGFPFEAPTDAYLSGRPQRIDFDGK